MGSGTVGISHVWQLPRVSMLVFCFMYLNTGVNEWKTSLESVNHIAVCLCVIFWSVKHIAECLCEWRISPSKCYIIINYLGSYQRNTSLRENRVSGSSPSRFHLSLARSHLSLDLTLSDLSLSIGLHLSSVSRVEEKRKEERKKREEGRVVRAF
jgi:hypothetical protein